MQPLITRGFQTYIFIFELFTRGNKIEFQNLSIWIWKKIQIRPLLNSNTNRDRNT